MSNLTTGSIAKHIRTIAIPASIGFFFNTMYNVTDTYFAGLQSDIGLAALAITFPVFFSVIAIGMGLSQGTNALISNELGAKKRKEAYKYSHQSLLFGFVLSVIFSIIGFIASPFLFSILGAQGQYLDLAVSYMNVIIFGVVSFFMAFILNGILMAHGDTKSFRNALIVGFFLNIGLNPLFMFTFNMGLSGIALATVVIELLTALYLGYHVAKLGVFKKTTFKSYIPDISSWKDLSVQGFPASLNMLTVSVGIFIVTYFLSLYSESVVAAYGVGTRIVQIAMLPTIGLNMAAMAIAGQNNGAKKYKRVKDTYYISLKYGLYLSLIGTFFSIVLAKPLMKLFTENPQIVSIGVTYIRVEALAFFGYTILFISVMFLQGLKQPRYSMYVGLSRQIIFPLLIFGWILYAGFSHVAIWWAVFAIVWIHALVLIYIVRGKIQRRLE